ncbi:MAG: response regulator transcription factor [Porphyromonadaceae bacterium]|nr:response regulator transcription factor [Porphyromonadaceae bacterium]
MSGQRILIADDHQLIIEGIIEIIKIAMPDAQIFSAENFYDLQQILTENKIDILFQDIRLGKDDAREFLNGIIKSHPDLKVIIISSLGDNASIDSLFKMGISGYLLKSDEKAEIVNAIDTVMHGGIYKSPEIIAAKKGNRIDPEQKVFLTPREIEILQLIMREKTTKEISELINLSEKTIESHRMNLFLKFDVKNVAGLVRNAILEGYLS